MRRHWLPNITSIFGKPMVLGAVSRENRNFSSLPVLGAQQSSLGHILSGILWGIIARIRGQNRAEKHFIYQQMLWFWMMLARLTWVSELRKCKTQSRPRTFNGLVTVVVSMGAREGEYAQHSNPRRKKCQCRCTGPPVGGSSFISCWNGLVSIPKQISMD